MKSFAVVCCLFDWVPPHAFIYFTFISDTIPSLLDLLLLHARYSAMLQCLSIGMKPCRFMMASRCTRVQGRALQSQSQFQHQRLSARWTSSKPRSGSNSSGGSGSGSSSGDNRTRDLVISGVSVCCVLGALYYFEQSKAKAAASRNADKAVGKVSMAVCVCGLVVYVVWRYVM